MYPSSINQISQTTHIAHHGISPPINQILSLINLGRLPTLLAHLLPALPPLLTPRSPGILRQNDPVPIHRNAPKDLGGRNGNLRGVPIGRCGRTARQQDGAPVVVPFVAEVGRRPVLAGSADGGQVGLGEGAGVVAVAEGGGGVGAGGEIEGLFEVEAVASRFGGFGAVASHGCCFY